MSHSWPGLRQCWPRRAGIQAGLLALAGLCAAPAAEAQVLPFHVYGLDEGVPQSQVNTLAQDGEGFLWVGTQGGLARFNGEVFTPYFVGDALGSNRIQELLDDGAGTLWVATVGGLSRWSGHVLSAVSHPLLDGVRCRALAQDASGVLWVGTDAGLLRREGASFRRVGDPAVVFDLAPDGAGLLAATSRGVWRVEDGRLETLVPTEVLGSEPWAVARAEGAVHVGTVRSGLWRIEGAVARRVREVEANVVYRIQTGARTGTLYVSTNDAGLFWRAPGQGHFERWTVRQGLPSDVVNTALEDHEGSLWVGTDIGGLARLSNRALSNFGVAAGLPSACVFGITRDRLPGRLWVATLKGAALLETGPRPRVLETIDGTSGLGNEWVWAVQALARGELWLMTDSAWKVRREGRSGLHDPPPVVQNLHTAPHDMTVDTAGRLWLARKDPRGGLLFRGESGEWRVASTREDGSLLTTGQHLSPRRAGGVWLAAGPDVFWHDGERMGSLPAPPLPRSSHLGAVLEDSRGRVWTGSDGGLALFENGRWRALNETPGFLDHRIFFLGEDGSGSIWAGTARGVFRFSPDASSVAPFGTEEGLPNLETNQGGFHLDPDGGVWLGTVGGLSHLAAAGAAPAAVAPRLVVESIELAGRLVPFPGALDLSWSERTATVHLAVLSFRARRHAAYRARMEGLEGEWLPPRASGELRYTNLPPGRLELQLQARNDSGSWGPLVRLPVQVRPPFWMTGAFRWALALAAAALALGAHRWRVHALRRHNEELQALVALRTHEIASSRQRLQEAQDQLSRLLESSGQAQEDLETWAAKVGADIARAVGASGLGAFVGRPAAFAPLGAPPGAAPAAAELERIGQDGELAEVSRLLLPITGPTGEGQGVLAVGGPPGAWSEAERQLFRGFAHQLGGALEVRAIRSRLGEAQAARAALRQRMEEQGVLLVAVCPLCGECAGGGDRHCARDGAGLEPRLLPWRIQERYRLRRVLGEGGMGTVYLAEDEQLGREVAIKVVRPCLLDHPGMRVRFEREAHALAHIQHPAVLALHDSGTLDDGSAFLIMERLHGADVAAVLRAHGPGSPPQVAHLLLQAAGALAAAHRAGLLHRDVKPENIVLTADPEPFGVKLVDFGLAREIGGTSDLTATGTVIGTPAYMAPEQVYGRPLSPRSDLYALAAVGYECLTGLRVVLATTTDGLYAELAFRTPPPPSELRPGLGRASDAGFAAALAKDPEDRPLDPEAWARDVAAALAASAAGGPGWPPGFALHLEAGRGESERRPTESVAGAPAADPLAATCP